MRSVKNKSATRRAKALFFLFALALFGFVPVGAQQTAIVDKMVATVNNSELITYSDLLWQLALEPDTPLASLARPRSEELQRALQIVIDQILIWEEAEKLTTNAPRDEEVRDELAEILRRFPSPEVFYNRISRVGLSSEQLTDILRRRVLINKYLDFRFRSFTVITDAEVQDYYRDVEVPRFRQQQPGQVVPALEKLSPAIRQTLTEEKIASEMGDFLDDARQRAEIVYLSPV